MNKVLKIAGITVGVLAGLVVVVFVVLKLISDDQYKEWITSAVRSATGRDFSIDTLDIDLNTSLKVMANDVRMANAEWGSRPDMLSVGGLEAEVSLLSLLGGVAEIRTVVSRAAVIVETDADGASNWAIDRGEPGDEEIKEEADVEKDEFGLPIRPLIREFRIEDFTLTLVESPGAVAKTARLEKLLIETPQRDTTLSLSAAYGELPIKLNGNLGSISDVLDRQSSSLKLDGNVGDNQFGISGSWGPLVPDPNMNLNLKVEIPSTAQVLSAIGYELKALGIAKVNMELAATDGQFSVSRILTNIDGDIAAASVKGSISDLMALDGIDITAQARTTALNQLLEILDQKLPVELPPNVEVSATVHGNLDGLGVKDFIAKIVDEGVDVTVTGSIGNVLSQEEIDATITAKVASTADLSKYAGLKIPNLGSIDLSARVASADKTISLNDLAASLASDNINLSITGGIADVVSVRGIDAALSTEIGALTPQNVTELETLFEQLEIEVPLDLLPQSTKLEARAAGDLDALSISDVNAEVRDEGILVTLAGSAANAMGPEGVEAGLTFKGESLSALSKYARMDLPEVGSLDLSAQVKSEGGVFALESLDAALQADEFGAALNAAITEIRLAELMSAEGVNLSAISGVSAELESTVNSLDALSDFARTELPVTDPIVLKANVSDGSEGEKRTATAIVDVRTGGAKLTLEGLLADLASLDNLEVSILVEADSLSDFDKLARRELPAKGPLKLSGTAKARPNEYTLDDFQLTLDDQSANGFVGIKLAEAEADNHTLEGVLNIPYLDLSPLLAGAPDDETAAGQAEAEPGVEPATKDVKEDQELAAVEDIEQEVTDRLFSKDPLPLGQLRRIDADFSVTAQRLKLDKLDMADFNMALTLKEGLLNIDPIKGMANSGTLDGNIVLDGRDESAELGVDILIDDLPMPRLGGGLDIEIDLDGEGASAADLMGGLDGEIIIVVRDGTITHSFATNFGSGLFSFSGGKKSTRLECGILRVEIEDGFVDFNDKLAVQLSDVTWRGGGDIDLKTEKLDVGIAPKPRKGIGIGAGSLASLVHVGGTLKNPKIQLDPTDVALKYGKYMAAISTGGLSILAGALVDRSKANVDVCAQILDGTVFDEDAAAEAPSQSDGESESEEGASTQTVEDPGQATDTPQQSATPESTVDETGVDKPEKKDRKLVPKNLQ